MTSSMRRLAASASRAGLTRNLIRRGSRIFEAIMGHQRLFCGAHRDGIARAVLHRGGEQPVDARPGLADLGRERIAEAALERPQQRLADDLVVLRLDAVAAMAGTQGLHL